MTASMKIRASGTGFEYRTSVMFRRKLENIVKTFLHQLDLVVLPKCAKKQAAVQFSPTDLTRTRGVYLLRSHSHTALITKRYTNVTERIGHFNSLSNTG